MALWLLHEASSGYALFERIESEDIAAETPQAQKSILDYGKFCKVVKMRGFSPFKSPEAALANINAVSEGVLHEDLQNFLSSSSLASSSKKKKGKVQLGVGEDKLGTAIQETCGISCVRNVMVKELLRGIRLHLAKFLEVHNSDLEKAQLGLSHAYSRAKVKFNINRVDNMIIQSIALVDQMDKDINTFAMRVREWYSWHFPELVRIVPDNIVYAKLAHYIKNKDRLTEEHLDELEELTLDRNKAEQILEASRTSMGQDISEIDMLNVIRFAERVVDMARYREELHQYLSKKMDDVAPNLTALIGEIVGARLISHAGSLTNLAKYPASTLQILGAEKALFRALKTRSNTPKYGLIYNSSFIGRAGAKNKGRISRYLANKCTIASRIDCFSDEPTAAYGKKLREQVEERLEFYDSGAAPRKNADVMALAIEEAGGSTKRQKTRSSSDAEAKLPAMDDDDDEEETEKKSSKKKKKSKDKGKKKFLSSSSSSSSSSSFSSKDKKKKRKRD